MAGFVHALAAAFMVGFGWGFLFTLVYSLWLNVDERLGHPVGEEERRCGRAIRG